MLRAHERNLDIIPVGELGIIALDSCREMGDKINRHIVSWRTQREHELNMEAQLYGYNKSTYLVPAKAPRFGSGEAKGQIFDTVRGKDLYILADVCNHSITYQINGLTNRMSPDDHFQDIKRIISAIGGKARRITVIMPFLYESRQMTRSGRESLDCAIALQELIHMGVTSIITFDAHDPRIMNSIPLSGFENYQTVYQFIKGIYRSAPDFQADPEHLMIVSPDEGGMKRSIYMANVLGSVDMGMFYKRKDYSRIVNGKHPVVAHEFLGADVAGKDVVIIDDMISSGRTVLEVAAELKKRDARRVFICSTFGLFTGGLARFDEAWKAGIFHTLLTTNLVYQRPELFDRPYYTGCDLSKFLALIIDTMNHDGSVSTLLDPIDRIHRFLKLQKKRQADEAAQADADGSAIDK